MTFVLLLGLLAGTVGGVIGFGSSVLMMPALVWMWGPRQAVPVMAVAALLANAGRVAAWWRELDWRATFAYCATAVPAAVAGASTLMVLPARLIDAVIGTFLISMIPLRRMLAGRQWTLTRTQLALGGAVIGYITGLVVSTGPINAPLFLAYGLVQGAYLGTEALCSLAVYAAKAVTFRSYNALPVELIVHGLAVGSSLMAGAFIGKRFVLRLDASHFRLLIECMLLVAGLTMLLAALRGG